MSSSESLSLSDGQVIVAGLTATYQLAVIDLASKLKDDKTLRRVRLIPMQTYNVQ